MSRDRRSPIALRLRSALGGTLLAAALVLAGLPGAAAAAREPRFAATSEVAELSGAASLDDLEAELRRRPDDLRRGSEYRQAAIAAGEHDRAIALFTELTERHPRSAAARLNLAYAYVDKIPAAGSITQVILANTALGHFTAVLELEESWLARYTRGNSYVYWPPIFGRTKLGIADLERAIEIAEEESPRPIHARAWVALGDGHWRSGDREMARTVWRQGLDRYPGDAGLEARLSRDEAAIETLFEELYALGQRVDTDLAPLWEER